MQAWNLQREIRRRRALERGRVFSGGAPRVALLFPSAYQAGMSSLGFQWIADRLSNAGFGVERFFLPPSDHRGALLGEEYETPLGEFQLVAVSLGWEHQIPDLFRCLESSGIPSERERRTRDHPSILIGGPITWANPRPLMPFVDAMLLGEADDTVVPAVQAFFDPEIDSWMERIAALPGGWTPSMGDRLPSRAIADNAGLPAYSRIMSPETDLFEMHLVEGERGCPRGCDFCVMRRTTGQATRFFDPDRILATIPAHAARVGLVGAAISDHPALCSIVQDMVGRGLQVGLSSLRADRVAENPALVDALVRGGARSLTVASDAASESLRRSIHKGITEQHLKDCAEIGAAHHLEFLKLYLMIGLPGETVDDLDECARLVLDLSTRLPIVLGVSPFVPKPGTPMAQEPFLPIREIERRMEHLRNLLRGGVEIRATSARQAWVEYRVAQGGPETGLALLRAWRAGGRFSDLRRELQ